MARLSLALVFCLGATALSISDIHAQALGDQDKLDLIYSTRFEFTDSGLPIMNVMLMEGQKEVQLSSPDGLTLLPDGKGGPAITGGSQWLISVRNSKPAKIRFWTIVSRKGNDAEARQWKKRGYKTKIFETGLVFGMAGDLIDSRQTLVGISPTLSQKSAPEIAKEISKKWQIEAFVFPEMLERPKGQLIARQPSLGVEVRNEQLLWFSPNGKKGLTTVDDVRHGDKGSQRRKAKISTRRYAGEIYVTLDWNGRLSVVNSVPVDRLLKGTVPAEIYTDAPMDALRAQAIAARDELFSRIGTRFFAKPYVTCSSQQCQVYAGYDKENKRTNKAVDDTRGQVLFRKTGNELVPAYYSAACGGFTEHNENIWGTPPDPNLRGHLDAHGLADEKALARFADGVSEKELEDFLSSAEDHVLCGQTRYGKNRCRWTKNFSQTQLDSYIREAYPRIGRIQSLRAIERGISGRIRKLEIKGSGGTEVVEGDLRIRRMLGGLKSSLFVAKRNAGQWEFRGAGFGHGVGMCQTGAIALAQKGVSFTDILLHYYRGSRIRPLY